MQGYKITKPVSGIAMGLISRTEEDGSQKIAVLSDIQGMEDFLGDMDFKVTGTEVGVTAIQMDIKIHGLSREILEKALAQAKEGRAHILDVMLEEIPEPRKEMSKYAPRSINMMIDPDKIRIVIGPGGKTINRTSMRLVLRLTSQKMHQDLSASTAQTWLEQRLLSARLSF